MGGFDGEEGGFEKKLLDGGKVPPMPHPPPHSGKPCMYMLLEYACELFFYTSHWKLSKVSVSA